MKLFIEDWNEFRLIFNVDIIIYHQPI